MTEDRTTKNEVKITLGAYLGVIMPAIVSAHHDRVNLPAKVALQIARLRRFMKPSVEAHDEVKGSLVDRLCTKDDQGNPIEGANPGERTIEGENLAEFNAAMDEMLNSEYKIPASMIPDIDTIDGDIPADLAIALVELAQ